MSFEAFFDDLAVQLYKEGFTILHTSDIRKLFHENLCEDTGKYEIVSVMIPHLYYEMFSQQPFVGLVVPCQITVYERKAAQLEVTVVNPSELIFRTIGNPTLQNIAEEISRRLQAAVDQLIQKPAGMPDGLT